MSATLGVDVGGTFTDFFLVDEATGETRTHKVASTPDDPSRAILQGLRALAPRGGLAFLAHGTTVATNALIQRRGGKVALVTTEGFKDLLEIGRQTRPKIYDLKADHPEPLVPREHRFEVAERVGPAGEVILPLGDADVRRAIADVQASGAESVAVCFLFSFLNPRHEQRMGEALRAALPGIDVSLSCEVQPEFREYERLSTTVLNAFLQPVAGRYMTRLEAAVEQHAAGAGIGICQSSGGLMSIARAAEMPIRTALSGPAAGVVGAVAAGRAPAAAISSRSTWAAPRRTSAWSATARPRWRSAAASPASRCGCRRSISTPSGPAAAPSLTSGATASCASGP